VEYKEQVFLNFPDFQFPDVQARGQRASPLATEHEHDASMQGGTVFTILFSRPRNCPFFLDFSHLAPRFLE